MTTSNGSTAPRVTLGDIEKNIQHTDIVKYIAPSGQVLRWAVLTTRNGFVVAGRPSAAACSENDDAYAGEAIAIEKAKQELWPLMGYALKECLHNQASAAPPAGDLKADGSRVPIHAYGNVRISIPQATPAKTDSRETEEVIRKSCDKTVAEIRSLIARGGWPGKLMQGAPMLQAGEAAKEKAGGVRALSRGEAKKIQNVLCGMADRGASNEDIRKMRHTLLNEFALIRGHVISDPWITGMGATVSAR